MTIWYMDYEAGTDADASVGNGDSFATRRKRINNFVAVAIAPGDEIRIMASPAPSLVGNATWTDGPLPSTISITSSTNATPIVITTGTHNLTTGDTVIINGHATNTNANGVWKVTVLSSTTFSLQNADGTNSVGNGVGTSGTLRKFNNAVVTLTSPVTQNIALCGNRGTKTNWTASADVTNTVINTDYKEGGECLQIAIGAAFTTGLAAYLPITSLNLSAYQQVSFWVKQTAGTIGAAGAARLRLCTDGAGAVPVHDVPIPALGALNLWVPVVVNLGVNLNAAIQSVRFDVVTDNGAQTFLIDNIIACKAASSADSLNLTSLISKDPGDHTYGDTYECWWGIQSINGTRVVLDGTTNSIPGSSPQRGYAARSFSVESSTYSSPIQITATNHGLATGATVTIVEHQDNTNANGTRVITVTGANTFTLDGSTGNGVGGATGLCSVTQETVATYKRETIKTVAAVATSTNVQIWQDSGGAGNLISYTGGWNRTDMSTQTGETWFDGQNGIGFMLSDAANARPYVSFDKLNGCRYSTSVKIDGSNDCSIIRMEATNTSAAPLSVTSYRLTATTISAVACSGSITTGTAAIVATIGRADSAIASNGSVLLGAGSWTGTVKQANNNSTAGVQTGNSAYISTIEKTCSNAFYGYIPGTYSVCGSVNAFGNNATGISFGSSAGFEAKVLGGTVSSVSAPSTGKSYMRNVTVTNTTEVTSFNSYFGACVYSEKHDGVTGNNVIFCEGGRIRTDTTTVHGAAAYSWKFSPTSTNRSQYYPLNQSIAKVACAANAPVTIKAWFRRDNTGLTAKLVCKGGQLSGVPADVTSSMTAIANTWEELTITFTPTESGVVDIEAQFWGGTTYNGWVSDATISQA